MVLYAGVYACDVHIFATKTCRSEIPGHFSHFFIQKIAFHFSRGICIFVHLTPSYTGFLSPFFPGKNARAGKTLKLPNSFLTLTALSVSIGVAKAIRRTR